jgi:hypothetical protein
MELIISYLHVFVGIRFGMKFRFTSEERLVLIESGEFRRPGRRPESMICEIFNVPFGSQGVKKKHIQKGLTFVNDLMWDLC